MKKIFILCFILAILIRVYSVFPLNTIFGFDQARDFFDAYTMVQTHHPRIIGPTAGNNPNLHHGIAFIYYLAVPIAIFGPNPMNAVYFNILIQSMLVFILAYLSWELFKNKTMAVVTAIMTAFSYHLTQFSGWLSNPTVTLVTVPLFYLSLWKYRQNEKWLIVAALALGASIEFELFFIYLIPVFLIFWVFYRPKLPSLKVFFVSVVVFLLSVSTMVVTEFKYSFGGVKDLLSAGSNVGGSLPLWRRLHFFSIQLGDQLSFSLAPVFPTVLAIVACIFIYFKTKDKKTRQSLGFLYLYVASPALMLFLGAHNAPWFLIGLPPAIITLYAYLFSRMKIVGYCILAVLIPIGFLKISMNVGSGQRLLEPDQSAVLSRQIAAIDYTYQNAQGESFAIDTVTNPLYVNAVWGYNYMWYGKQKYGYLPHWLGGDQLPPYNVLEKTNEMDKTLFVLMDMTDRIPEPYRKNALRSLESSGEYISKKSFDEISVYQFERK